MSIKSEFNKHVKSYCKRTGTKINRIGEPKLVEILVDVLNMQPNIRSKMYHQKYVDFSFAGRLMRRELCDTLLIVKHSTYFRVSFIQNKKKTSHYKGLDKFRINCGQHYLLQKKPTFTPTAGSGILPAVSSFIHRSVYDTVTTYSVFYFDSKNDYDIDLASSCSVCCKASPVCSGCGAKSTGAVHNYTFLN